MIQDWCRRAWCVRFGRIRVFALIVAGVLLNFGNSLAFEGTAYFCVNDLTTYDSCGIDGIWRVDIASGERIQLFGSNDGSSIIDFATLSWDGRHIGFAASSKVYTMGNDGSGLKRLDGMRNPPVFAWTRNGMYYSYNAKEWNTEGQPEYSRLYHYDPETQVETMVYEQDSIKGRYTGWRGTFGSATGEVLKTRIYQHSSCGYLPAENPETSTNHDGKSYFHLSSSGKILKVFAWRDWGHGGDMTMCGRYMCHQVFSSHNGFWVRRTSDGATIQQFGYGPVTATKTGLWDQRHCWVSRCTNNPDYFIMKLLGNWKSSDPVSSRMGSYHVYNFKTDSFEADIPNPVDGTYNLQCGKPGFDYGHDLALPFGLWLGDDLPSPTETQAYIATLDNKLTFGVAGESATMTKSAEILNLGQGTMERLSVQVDVADSSWLSARVNVLNGNKQYVLVDVEPGAVPSGTTEATITLSSANARNTATITIVAFADKLAQPTFLMASKVITSENPVTLTWSDNSTAEDGYIVECCTTNCFGRDEEFSIELARVGADVDTFIYNNPDGRDAHRRNVYRVRAYSDTYESSVPSMSAKFFASQSRETVDYTKVHPWVTVTEPKRGFVYPVGENCTISWISDDIATIKLEYSTDQGETWQLIADDIAASSSLHQSYQWSVPSSLDGVNLMVRAIDADDPNIRSTRLSIVKDIRIGDASVSATPMRDRAAGLYPVSVDMHSSVIRIRHGGIAEGHTVRLLRLNGVVVSSQPAGTRGTTTIAAGQLSAGAYLLELAEGDRVIFKQKVCRLSK